jgi:hypothetical protein
MRASPTGPEVGCDGPLLPSSRARRRRHPRREGRQRDVRVPGGAGPACWGARAHLQACKRCSHHYRVVPPHPEHGDVTLTELRGDPPEAQPRCPRSPADECASGGADLRLVLRRLPAGAFSNAPLVRWLIDREEDRREARASVGSGPHTACREDAEGASVFRQRPLETSRSRRSAPERPVDLARRSLSMSS